MTGLPSQRNLAWTPPEELTLRQQVLELVRALARSEAQKDHERDERLREERKRKRRARHGKA